MAGPAGLVGVVADLGACLFAIQRLDGGVDIQNPWGAQCTLHAGQQLGDKPGAALLCTHARQGAAQSVFTDDFVHAQDLWADRIIAQTGDVGIALVTG